MSEILKPGSKFNNRFIEDYQHLSKSIEELKKLNKKIVLTAGTYDILHIGHGRYLEEAKKSSKINPKDTILVVGVDADEQVRRRKGKHRPLAPQNERLEMLCHLEHVDIVTLAYETGPQWKLMEAIKPDILIISKRVNATEDQKEKFRKFCNEIVELESQAETSTSAKIRRMLITVVEKVESDLKNLSRNIESTLSSLNEIVQEIAGDRSKDNDK